MKFLTPKNLNLEELLLEQKEIQVYKLTKGKFQTTTVKTKSLQKHLPYCYYIIHLISTKSSDKPVGDSSGYINLRSELLDQVIPRNTRIQVISLLKNLGVIQVNNSYQVDSFSKSYKLSPTYNSSDTIYLNLEQSNNCRNIGTKHIHDDLQKHSKESNRLVSKGNPYVSAISKRIERVKVGSKKLADCKTLDLLKLPEYFFQQEQINSITLDYNQIIKDGNADCLSAFIQKIETGEGLSININNKVNRVFSPITNLKKEYRKYLLCKNGNSLVEIDFKSSHLFHLIKEILNSNPLSDLKSEADRLSEIAVNSDIYEYVANHSNLAYLQLDRAGAKELFIESFLYGMYPNRKKSQLIKSIFPLTAAYLERQDRKHCSIQLQRSEAKLLNNLILKRIAIEEPNATVYGVFDSLLVDRDHFDVIMNIMIEEARSYFGFDVPIVCKEHGEFKKGNVQELAVKNEDVKNELRISWNDVTENHGIREMYRSMSADLGREMDEEVFSDLFLQALNGYYSYFNESPTGRSEFGVRFFFNKALLNSKPLLSSDA